MSIAPASSRGDRCWVGNRALEKGLPLTGLPESDSHGLLGGVGPKPSRIKSCGGARVNKFRRKRVLAITVKKGLPLAAASVWPSLERIAYRSAGCRSVGGFAVLPIP